MSESENQERSNTLDWKPIGAQVRDHSFGKLTQTFSGKMGQATKRKGILLWIKHFIIIAFVFNFYSHLLAVQKQNSQQQQQKKKPKQEADSFCDTYRFGISGRPVLVSLPERHCLLAWDVSSYLMFNIQTYLCWLWQWVISRWCPPVCNSHQSGRPCFPPQPARRYSPAVAKTF